MVLWYLHDQSLQLCPTLCDPIDCSPPGSTDHGIFQARILEGVPFPTPRDSLKLGIEPTSLASPDWQVDSLPLAPPLDAPLSYLIGQISSAKCTKSVHES